MLRILWRRKLLISGTTLSGFVLVLAYSLLLKDVYQASAVIAAASYRDTQSNLSLLTQQLGGIAGMSMPNSVSTSEIVNLLKSNIIKEKVIEKFGLMPVLLEEESGPGLSLSLFRAKDAKADGGKPKLWDGIRKLGGMVRVTSNFKDNTIIITAESTDPALSARLVSHMLEVLNDYMSSEAKRVALTNRRYLEGQLNATSDPLIKQKIYALVAQQIETSMMSEVKENFAFKVLDPPRTPDRKTGPKRFQIAGAGLLASFLVAVLAAFAVDYFVAKGLRGVFHEEEQQ